MEDLEKSFYKESKILLEGAIVELTSKIAIMRNYRIAKGYRDPISYVTSRIKTEESLKDKLKRKGLPIKLEIALKKIYDIVGVRIVCSYIEDIYLLVELLKKHKGIRIIKEKDYIKNPKENGYRSYHIILQLNIDVIGKIHKVNAEIQIRTIAMDCWASLEHQLKYKKNIENEELIRKELKRCADEMATTDLNLQTIKDLIIKEGEL